MKKILLPILFSAAFILSYTQDISYKVDAFQQIEFFGNANIELVKGLESRVEIKAGVEKKDNFKVSVKNTILEVRVSGKLLDETRTIDIKVYYQDIITVIQANGGADVWSAEVIKNKFIDLDAGSGGTIDIEVEAELVEAKVSSGSTISLKGEAEKLDCMANAGGTISAYQLEADHVVANVNTGGTAKVNASEKLEANATTTGNIRYKGTVTDINVESSLGGEVKKETE